MTRAEIIVTTRTVYFVPAKGRHYMTKPAAVSAVAGVLIEAKHPREKPEYGRDGQQYSDGWHWRELPRSDVLFRRVCRMVRKSMNKGASK